MKKKRKMVLGIVLLFIPFLISMSGINRHYAYASSILDFDTGSGYNPGDLTNGTPLNNFVVTGVDNHGVISGEYGMRICDGSFYPGSQLAGASQVLEVYSAGATVNGVSIKTTDGSHFRLESFDMEDSGSDCDTGSNYNYTIAGYKDGSSVISKNINLFALGKSQHFNFTAESSKWFDIDEIRIQYNYTSTPYIQILLDNIQVSGPLTQLEQVKNVTFERPGVVIWTDTDHEGGYKVDLYKNDNLLKSVNVGGVVGSGATIGHDFLDDIRNSGPGTYKAYVTAVGDGINYSSGEVSAPTPEQVCKKLSSTDPGSLTWTGNTAYWQAVADAVEYEVVLFRNGTATGDVVKVLAANVAYGADFTSAMNNKVGGYTFKVTAKGNGKLILDSDQSETSIEKVISTTLDPPAGLILDSNGLVCWSPVPNASYYEVKLYKNGADYLTNTVAGSNYHLLNNMRIGGEGEYTVKVRAGGDNIHYINSPWSPESNAQNVKKLLKAGSLNWSGNTAHWSAVANADSYEVQFYKDSNPLGNVKTVSSKDAVKGVDFSAEIADLKANGFGGDYVFTVKAIGDGKLFLDGDLSSFSATNHIPIPLPQVTGVSLSDKGVISWTDIDHASAYKIDLYKDGILQKSIQTGADKNSCDLLSELRAAGTGEYTLRIIACGDGKHYSDSLPSVSSNPQKVEQPSMVAGKLSWSGKTAHWNSVDKATGYRVQLLKNGTLTGDERTVTAAEAADGVDFTSAILTQGAGNYTFTVTAQGDQYLLSDAKPSLPSEDNLISPVPNSARFDLYTGSKEHGDIAVHTAASGKPLSSITNGSKTLIPGTDYITAGQLVTIKKAYLSTLSEGNVNLILHFGSDSDQSLAIAIINSKPAQSDTQGSGSDTPSGSNYNSTGETRTIPVISEDGNSRENRFSVMVHRNTEGGTTTDVVIFDSAAARQSVDSALHGTAGSISMDMTNMQGAAPDRIQVIVPEAVSALLGSGRLSFNINTDLACLYLSGNTLQSIKREGFQVQFSEASEEQAKHTKRLLGEYAAGGTMLGTPVNIDADYAFQTKITLPVPRKYVPDNASQREAFIASLGVLVEHSDGEVRLQKGTITYDKNGIPSAISIWVDKFSTFTLVQCPFSGKQHVIKSKQMPDKVLSVSLKKAVDSKSVTEDSVYILDSKGNKVDFSWQVWGKRITIAPKEYWTAGETYTLYFTDQIRDTSGKSMGKESSYRFTIGQISLKGIKIKEYNGVKAAKVWKINLKKTIDKKAQSRKYVTLVDENCNEVKAEVSVENNTCLVIRGEKAYTKGKTYYLIIDQVVFQDGKKMDQASWLKFTIAK